MNFIKTKWIIQICLIIFVTEFFHPLIFPNSILGQELKLEDYTIEVPKIECQCSGFGQPGWYYRIIKSDSEYSENTGWFFNSWECDPSIKIKNVFNYYTLLVVDWSVGGGLLPESNYDILKNEYNNNYLFRLWIKRDASQYFAKSGMPYRICCLVPKIKDNNEIQFISMTEIILSGKGDSTVYNRIVKMENFKQNEIKFIKPDPRWKH